ncbi:hypothetical protein PHMEG_00012275 [Phytophthora megakarya]|uniref:Uncharacterized protein n=1 Tax=Phytophthora megakarya TaxID=4795 RepID=A0A225WA40_9STRA|nr:hypothetical protein PHMEG_00012275 [Phytophthora megakarya]
MPFRAEMPFFIFKCYKPLVGEVYKMLPAFNNTINHFGVVQCRNSPEAEPVLQDLRRKITGALLKPTSVPHVHALHGGLESSSTQRRENAGTTQQDPRVCLEEIENNYIYAGSSEQQETGAKTSKQAHREHRSVMSATAIANQYRRGRELAGEAHPTPKKSRK